MSYDTMMDDRNLWMSNECIPSPLSMLSHPLALHIITNDTALANDEGNESKILIQNHQNECECDHSYRCIDPLDERGRCVLWLTYQSNSLHSIPLLTTKPYSQFNSERVLWLSAILDTGFRRREISKISTYSKNWSKPVIPLLVQVLLVTEESRVWPQDHD